MKSIKNKYQIVVVLSTKAEDRSKLTEKVEKWIKGDAAEIVKTDHLGIKDLVYEIRHQKKGDFYVYDLESEKPIELKELNLYLNREADIIRYLILKV